MGDSLVYCTVQYSTVQCSAVQYSTAQHRGVWEELIMLCTRSEIGRQEKMDKLVSVSNTVEHSSTIISDILSRYSTVQYSTVQYSTVQYSTVQYSTVQYSTVQYSTAPSSQTFSPGRTHCHCQDSHCHPQSPHCPESRIVILGLTLSPDNLCLSIQSINHSVS